MSQVEPSSRNPRTTTLSDIEITALRDTLLARHENRIDSPLAIVHSDDVENLVTVSYDSVQGRNARHPANRDLVRNLWGELHSFEIFVSGYGNYTRPHRPYR